MDAPSTQCRRRPGWKRAIAGVLIACMVIASHPATTSGQTDPSAGIADADFASRQTAIVLSATLVTLVGAPPLAPFVIFWGGAWIFWVQTMLWSSILVYDEALVRAWTTENLLALDYGLRSAASLVPDYMQKLTEDQKILNTRINDANRDMFQKNLTGPALVAAKDAVALQDGYLEAVNVKLDWAKQNLPALNAKCEALIGPEGALAVMRRHFVGGSPSRPTTPEERARFAGWDGPSRLLSRDVLSAQNNLAKAFADYLNTAIQFSTTIMEPVSVGVTTSQGMQKRLLPPTASAHLKVSVSNDSTDLVFFVKVVPKHDGAAAGATGSTGVPPGNPCGREQGTLFQQREIRAMRGWMPIFPKGTVTRINPEDALNLGRPPVRGAQTGPVGAGTPEASSINAADVQFSSAIWFAVEPGDQLEFRVATFGPMRKQIRFLDLRGALVRPDLYSLRRSYYYLGYELVYGSLQRFGSRLYSTSENYHWSGWEGAWDPHGLPAKTAQTSPADFWEAPPWVNQGVSPPAPMGGNFNVQGDHIVWAVPETPEARTLLDKDPFMRVYVTGKADFVRYVNPQKPTSVPLRLSETSKDGALSVNVEPW